MAYDDWPEEFQEVWDDLERQDGFEGLSGSELEYAEYMFEEGFMHYAGEISPADTEFARGEFFDMIGQEWEDIFDWEGWREAMGYDLWVSRALAPAPKPSHGTGRKAGNVRGFGVFACPKKKR